MYQVCRGSLVPNLSYRMMYFSLFFLPKYVNRVYNCIRQVYIDNIFHKTLQQDYKLTQYQGGDDYVWNSTKHKCITKIKKTSWQHSKIYLTERKWQNLHQANVLIIHVALCFHGLPLCCGILLMQKGLIQDLEAIFVWWLNYKRVTSDLYGFCFIRRITTNFMEIFELWFKFFLKTGLEWSIM